MMRDVQTLERDPHFARCEGKWAWNNTERTYIFLFKPNVSVATQNRLLSNATLFQYKAGASILLMMATLITSISLIAGHHFFYGPLFFTLFLLSTLLVKRLDNTYKMTKNWKEYMWDCGYNGTVVQKGVAEAYITFTKGRNIASRSDWDLLSVNDEDFYYECAAILELEERIKSLDIGIRGSAETALQVKSAMDNINKRVLNIKQTASYGADAALYAVASNILDGQEAVPIEMVQDAEFRHSTLKALGKGSEEPIVEMEDDDEDEKEEKWEVS